jgi:hypothetical protein
MDVEINRADEQLIDDGIFVCHAGLLVLLTSLYSTALWQTERGLISGRAILSIAIHHFMTNGTELLKAVVDVLPDKNIGAEPM